VESSTGGHIQGHKPEGAGTGGFLQGYPRNIIQAVAGGGFPRVLSWLVTEPTAQVGCRQITGSGRKSVHSRPLAGMAGKSCPKLAILTGIDWAWEVCRCLGIPRLKFGNRLPKRGVSAGLMSSGQGAEVTSQGSLREEGKTWPVWRTKRPAKQSTPGECFTAHAVPAQSGLRNECKLGHAPV